jgi:hypothetical protein
MTDNRKVIVFVEETNRYEFPDPDKKCPAHGQRLCIDCARNPSTCFSMTNAGDSGCGSYTATGMHWDTCPNRIR